jgi:DNA-binding PadR family transcriptional regulator
MFHKRLLNSLGGHLDRQRQPSEGAPSRAGPRRANRDAPGRRRPEGSGRETPASERVGDRRRDGGRGGRFGGGFGGRIFGPGDLRLILLELIAGKPSHGYELIKAIEQKVGGGYSPSPGSIYPTLTLLEELGHVRATTSEGPKRLFEITPEGIEFIARNQANIDGITARMGLAARAMSGHHPPPGVHQAMHTLKAALMLHRGDWSEAESSRVRAIIEQAAEQISREPERG